MCLILIVGCELTKREGLCFHMPSENTNIMICLNITTFKLNVQCSLDCWMRADKEGSGFVFISSVFNFHKVVSI